MPGNVHRGDGRGDEGAREYVVKTAYGDRAGHRDAGFPKRLQGTDGRLVAGSLYRVKRYVFPEFLEHQVMPRLGKVIAEGLQGFIRLNVVLFQTLQVAPVPVVLMLKENQAGYEKNPPAPQVQQVLGDLAAVQRVVQGYG